jgi:DNA polymerase I-like protein with 3'-5' exonuclease and polymerase domains
LEEFGVTEGSQQSIGFWTDSKWADVKSLIDESGLPLFHFIVSKDQPHCLCVAMGTPRLKDLQARGIIPKKYTLESARGRVYESSTGPIMVTFDPGLRSLRADAPQQIIWDMRLAYRYIMTGSLNPIIGKYEWVDDLSDFIEAIRAQYEATGEPVVIAVDTETMGLTPWAPGKEIVTIQFSMKEGEAIAVYTKGLPLNVLKQIIAQVNWILTSEMVRTRAANFKFDAGWLWRKWGIECTNFTMDTTVVGSMLNENRSNSLKWHAKEYTDMGGYEDELEAGYDKGHMELIPKEKLLPYAAGDPDATLRISNVMVKKISTERHLSRLYTQLTHPALRAFEKVERRGVLVDVEKIAELRNELNTYIGEREHQMVKLLSPKMRVKYHEKIKDRLAEGKEPLTPAMKGEFFFDKEYGLGLKPKMTTEKSGQPSTAHEHLTMFHDVPSAKEFVGVMKELGQARKMLSTYITGFMKHLRPDYRFHPTYMLFKGGLRDDDDSEGGTNTGRLSAVDPAWQTVPKHSAWAKKLRRCFPAPAGKVCWSRDFSQGELRIVACVAGEDRMVQAYKQGQDLHCVTGAQFAGLVYEYFLELETENPKLYEEKRQHGKTGNFGMLYGISAEGFQAFAWRTGILLTSAQAREYLSGFFDLYPNLRGYHDRQRAFAREHGFVISPLGRIRHLPLIRSSDQYTRGREERRAINSPIQSTLSDLCVWSVARIEEELGDEAGIVGMIHDQLHGYVDIDKAETLIPQIGQIMEELPYTEVFDWEPELSFPTDGTWGPTLGDMAKFKL